MSPSGYVIIGVDGVLYRAHRLAWLYVFGEWPVREIDHLNQIKTDNRIANLRDVDRGHNEANKSTASSASISGVRGVSPRQDGAFVARIARKRKLIHLGAFRSISEAEAAYLKAKAELGIGPIPAHVGCPNGS
ncbi:MAG: HNH endonuclease [Proteobacteria bacterium]|nr:HNH endonuclease [Pseudomonadota bacterium]